MNIDMRRRDLLKAFGVVPAALGQTGAPGVITSETLRPKVEWGSQVGDVTGGRAMLWAKTDRPSRLHVEYSTTEKFENPRKITGPHALDVSDFTARIGLTDLPPDQQIFYRASFQSLTDSKVFSQTLNGRFRTAPATRRNVRFFWSGDTAGQGFGINSDFGGMKIYEVMRQRGADLFIHSGDTIYADNPIPSEIKQADGTIWRNLTTEATGKAAETLAEFRGRYVYNLLDKNVRAFNAEIPQIWQWDDHEVLNNWSPSKDLSRVAQYTEKSLPMLAGRATRAFLEYAPMRFSDADSERIYRKIGYGPLLDIFVIDARSYRGPNTRNDQPQRSGDTDFLGRPQLEWLRRGLVESKAMWKVIASDMPIGLVVGDGKDASGQALFEASANGDGPALGRELEFAALFSALKKSRVRNIVWLTADVHYTAAHHYSPERATFRDFDPFWEFVSGPLNAGTFGPNQLDNTFGPAVVFQKAPPRGSSGLGPSAGMQFFGEVEIDGKSGEMTVLLKDLAGSTLHRQRLPPAR